MRDSDPAPPGRARLLLFLSVAAIALLTLVPVPGGRGSPGLCIFCGDRGASDFTSNVILFAPLGLALALRGNSLWRAALIGASFSLGIELAQVGLISGRDSSLGDLIANSLGTLVGWSAGFRRGWWLRRDGDLRRCLAVTSATLVALLGGLALFTPALPDSTYFLQWTMRFRGMSVYEGEVLSTRIGPLELPGRGRIEESDSVQKMLLSQPIEFTARAGPPPRRLAPIVSLIDERRREIMLLGATGEDLVYRHRVLANELRFDRASIRVAGVFEGIRPGDPFRLTWRGDAGGYCLDVGEKSECGRGFTVGDTWTLARSLNVEPGTRTVLNSIWLWMLFLPAGFLAARPRTVGVAAAIVVVVLSVAPILLGFAVTPVYQMGAALGGLVIGWLLARRVTRGSTADESPSVATVAGC